jgi:hypothetical protein
MGLVEEGCDNARCVRRRTIGRSADVAVGSNNAAGNHACRIGTGDFAVIG